jgi:FHS family glucose/mannose:H+ symporter-like MFS transporter
MASPQAELSESSSNRKLVLACQIAFFPTGIVQTVLGPMLPLLVARWTLNDTQAGYLFLVQFLAMLVGVQLTTLLLSRWGFRPAFLSGLLLMAAGIATLFIGSPGLGLVSVAVYGLGLGLIVPSDNLLIAEIGFGTTSGKSSEHGSEQNSKQGSRAGAVSLLNFFWGVGAVFCSLMVAWTATHKLLPIFLGSVALFLILLALAVRNLPFPAAETSAESSVSWKDLVKNPAIWLFAAVFFLYPGAETAVGGWVGYYVSRMGLGSRGAGIASLMPAFFWLALTVGRGLGTFFLRHFPEGRILQVGFGAGAAGIGLMIWAPSLTGVICGALTTGLSFATMYPVTVARLSQHFGVAARSIGAVMFSLASLGPAVIPWLVGVISHATGSLRAGLLLPLVATAILFVIHLFEW